MTLGESIREARKAAGLTQKQAAEKLGVSIQSIAKWEKEQLFPDDESMNKLSDLFGLELKKFGNGAILRVIKGGLF